MTDLPITRCHHHGFTVSSIERSLPFYQTALGLELVRISDRRKRPTTASAGRRSRPPTATGDRERRR